MDTVKQVIVKARCLRMLSAIAEYLVLSV